jgi:O-antigen/teichoic acid export membrane protein
MIPLSEFGYYSMAFTAANSLAFIFSAFYSNAYPRFSSRIAANEPEAGQLVLYRQYTVTLATIMTSVGFFLAAFGYPFVYAWTRSQSVALHVGPLFSLLVIGTAVHGIMYIPHAYQLAAGTTRIALTLNMSLALMQVPLILLLTSRFGSVGAAAAWLTLHIAYCLLGTVLMHRRFFRGHGLDWLVRDVGVPALVSACAAVLARLVVASTLEPVTRLFIGGGIGVLTLGTLVAWQPPVRELFVELFSARVRVAR